MQHLEEGLLQELLDGEIPSTDLPPIQAHLAACAECRARLEEARELAGEAERLIETIELREPGPRRGEGIPPRPSRWGRNLAWAATVLVAVGAGYLARGTAPAGLARQEAAAPSRAVAAASAVAEPAEPAARKAADPVRERRDEPEQSADRSAPHAARRPASPANAAPDAAVEAKVAAVPPEKSRDTSDHTGPKRKLGDTPLKLEEIVTTGVPEGRRSTAGMAVGKAAAPAPPVTQPLAARANEIQLDQAGILSRSAQRDAAPVEIGFVDALRRLGGDMRLIEGLVPLRLELLEPDVRVVYPITGGELILAQRLVEGHITFRLVAPSSFPVDSLERLRARVRD